MRNKKTFFATENQRVTHEEIVAATMRVKNLEKKMGIKDGEKRGSLWARVSYLEIKMGTTNRK